MIVSPDFPFHWKTLLLIRLTGGHECVLCLLKFWAHCQNRKTHRFPGMNPSVLSAICGWTGDAKLFWDAMAQTFIDVKDNEVIAHQWDEYNSPLICSWRNGEKGGRPKNPQVTPGIPHGWTPPSSLSPLSSPSDSVSPPPVNARRYPGSIDDALAMQPSGSPIPRDFVMACWDKANSRSGLDAKGIPIGDFNSYVRIEWKYEQDRIRERANGNGGIPVKKTRHRNF